MNFSEAVTLEGQRVRLEQLSFDHTDELTHAVKEGELWRNWYTRVPHPEKISDEIGQRLERQIAGLTAPYVVRDLLADRLVGMTSLINIRPENRRLEIGSTWLVPSVHGTGVNAEAKLLLLTRAFDDLQCIAVEIRAHWHNRQSRTAIEALGAKQDGVLRNHDLWTDGTMRDVVVYSIIESEWPTVRLGLKERLLRKYPVAPLATPAILGQ